MKFSALLKCAVFGLFALGQATFGQSWQPITTTIGIPLSLPLLLTDGTIMIHRGGTAQWYKLTPSIMGSYATGTFTRLADMPAGHAPLYYASAVLPDGRVVVVGGEYNGSSSAVWMNKCSMYDPVLNSWTAFAAPTGWPQIGDSQCVVQPDGQFLLGNFSNTKMAVLNANTLTWTAVPATGKTDRFDEEGWTLMPDGTILTVDAINNPQTEKYIPWLQQWIFSGVTPQSLAAIPSQEIGPAVLMPNGKVFATGGTGHNAVYQPGFLGTDLGTWTAAPDFPLLSNVQLTIADGPACLLPSGKVLCCASPGVFQTPMRFFEYDGTALNAAPLTLNAPSKTSYQGIMLMLPTGQVLFTDQSSRIELYNSVGTALPAWKPTISDSQDTVVASQNFTLTGTQFNGLSECSYYGDDAANSTNYPIVRITNLATNHVFYCRTKNHSRMGVASGSLPTSTIVTVPATIEQGQSNLQVVVNGIASDSYPVYVASPANVPTIGKYSPRTIEANSLNVSMVLTGSGFRKGDSLVWKSGTKKYSLPASLQSSELNQDLQTLTVNLPDKLLISTGTASIAVKHATGESSVTRPVTITTDLPSISTLSPSSRTANSGPFILTLSGLRFKSGDTLVWTLGSNTLSLPTTMLSSTSAYTTIPGSATTSPGTASIKVVSATGKVSNSVIFSVTN